MVDFQFTELRNLREAYSSHVERDASRDIVTRTTIHAQGVNGEIFTKTLAIGEVFRPADINFKLRWCFVSVHVAVTAYNTIRSSKYLHSQSFQTTYFD